MNATEDGETSYDTSVNESTLRSKQFLQKNASSARAKGLKRPRNAFIIYSNKWRKKIAAEHPIETNKEISKRLGEQWKLLSKEKRRQYEEEAETAKAIFLKENPTYRYKRKTQKQKLREAEEIHEEPAETVTRIHQSCDMPSHPHCVTCQTALPLISVKVVPISEAHLYGIETPTSGGVYYVTEVVNSLF